MTALFEIVLGVGWGGHVGGYRNCVGIQKGINIRNIKTELLALYLGKGIKKSLSSVVKSDKKECRV